MECANTRGGHNCAREDVRNRQLALERTGESALDNDEWRSRQMYRSG
jgi:hypothetical protein